MIFFKYIFWSSFGDTVCINSNIGNLITSVAAILMASVCFMLIV